MENLTEKRPPNVLTSDTENATIIPVGEAPPAQHQKYANFRAYNTDLWNGPRRENKEAIRRQDNLHIYDALASELELTDYQKKEGRRIFDDLNIRSFGKKVEYIIFAVCVLVANRDVPDGHRYWPHPQAQNNSELFAETARALDMNRSEQLSVVQQVAYDIDEYDSSKIDVMTIVKPDAIGSFFD